jgi:hypothetical protein
MTLLEFLDRMGERRAARPQRPARDIRQFIGFMFLMGYYVLVWKFTTGDVPKANIDLIRDAMLTLGPPVGLIVGAPRPRSSCPRGRLARPWRLAPTRSEHSVTGCRPTRSATTP